MIETIFFAYPAAATVSIVTMVAFIYFALKLVDVIQKVVAELRKMLEVMQPGSTKIIEEMERPDRTEVRITSTWDEDGPMRD